MKPPCIPQERCASCVTASDPRQPLPHEHLAAAADDYHRKHGWLPDVERRRPCLPEERCIPDQKAAVAGSVHARAWRHVAATRHRLHGWLPDLEVTSCPDPS